jgi:hypothetical protein
VRTLYNGHRDKLIHFLVDIQIYALRRWLKHIPCLTKLQNSARPYKTNQEGKAQIPRVILLKEHIVQLKQVDIDTRTRRAVQTKHSKAKQFNLPNASPFSNGIQ